MFSVYKQEQKAETDFLAGLRPTTLLEVLRSRPKNVLNAT